MANRIEPPVLLSRLMAFIFCATAVVAGALLFTLVKMYPLDKTQIFFMTTRLKSDMEIRLMPFTPDNATLEIYKQAFIKEYIKQRNEVIQNAGVMRRKWGADVDGTVYMWSTPEIYTEFVKTQMWNAAMNDMPDFGFSCPVEFFGIAPRSENTYAVSFRYFCTNNDGQSATQSSNIVLNRDYTIAVTLVAEEAIKWTARLENPLGLRVSGYTVESGGGDPLDFR